jgi:hypothetical protein
MLTHAQDSHDSLRACTQTHTTPQPKNNRRKYSWTGTELRKETVNELHNAVHPIGVTALFITRFMKNYADGMTTNDMVKKIVYPSVADERCACESYIAVHLTHSHSLRVRIAIPLSPRALHQCCALCSHRPPSAAIQLMIHSDVHLPRFANDKRLTGAANMCVSHSYSYDAKTVFDTLISMADEAMEKDGKVMCKLSSVSFHLWFNRAHICLTHNSQRFRLHAYHSHKIAVTRAQTFTWTASRSRGSWRRTRPSTSARSTRAC